MRRTIHTVHHLPASGGTVLSQAVAAMQDCILLSEVHPDRKFWAPYNPIVQITRGYRLLSEAETKALDDLFLKDIAFIHRAAMERGMQLVVRDHAFIDFMAQNRLYSRLVAVLREEFSVNSLVTTRDPIDVWISCSLNGWLGDLNPETFCFRYRKMLEHFAGVPRLTYEDFVADPTATLQKICRIFDLRFAPNFQQRMAHIRHITGNSGRRAPQIAPRPRQWDKLARDAARAFLASEQYSLLCQETGYVPITENDVARCGQQPPAPAEVADGGLG